MGIGITFERPIVVWAHITVLDTFVIRESRRKCNISWFYNLCIQEQNRWQCWNYTCRIFRVNVPTVWSASWQRNNMRPPFSDIVIKILKQSSHNCVNAAAKTHYYYKLWVKQVYVAPIKLRWRNCILLPIPKKWVINLVYCSQVF